MNDNGQYVCELAKKVLEEADALIVRAREYDRKNRTIAIGVCAPAPVWRLAPILSNLFPHMTIQTEQDEDRRLMSGLDNGMYQIVVTHEKPDDRKYCCKACGRESLMFALPKGHRYSRRKTLSFAEMNGENMLLMPDIGFWGFVKDRMPDSRFLTQSDRFSFNELVQASSLPSFSSDLAEKYTDVPDGRIKVPISDEEATVTYYLVCKADKKKPFAPLFSAV